ncbi:MAG TPA: hypothetical protein VGH99_07820 [Pseudonocardia sp.]
MAYTPMSHVGLDTFPSDDHGPFYDHRADLIAVQGNLFDGEAIHRSYRGRPPGVQLLAVTSRRLMMIEAITFKGRTALSSIPFGRVTSVHFLSTEDQPIETTRVVGIRVMTALFEFEAVDAEQAREAHDLVVWSVTHG